ncbi:transposon Ty3-G Gag-Pol polyprotein [Trichonephila clavipes]|nr:transposon Ty3-G Gag-Pol polyprotein [Trichonephila clavipes]
MEKGCRECLFNCCSETKGLWRLLQQEVIVKNFSIGEQVVLLIPDSMEPYILLEELNKNNIITTLDLLKGYWAIPMAEDRKKILHLSRLIGNSTVSREFSRAYIDDISQSSSKLGRTSSSDTILTKLSELNFTVNLKSVPLKTQIKYLGHIIGSGKHEPDPEKTAVINNLPVPKRRSFVVYLTV